MQMQHVYTAGKNKGIKPCQCMIRQITVRTNLGYFSYSQTVIVISIGVGFFVLDQLRPKCIFACKQQTPCYQVRALEIIIR